MDFSKSSAAMHAESFFWLTALMRLTRRQLCWLSYFCSAEHVGMEQKALISKEWTWHKICFVVHQDSLTRITLTFFIINLAKPKREKLVILSVNQAFLKMIQKHY